jgi:hypothetical protein
MNFSTGRVAWGYSDQTGLFGSNAINAINALNIQISNILVIEFRNRFIFHQKISIKKYSYRILIAFIAFIVFDPNSPV